MSYIYCSTSNYSESQVNQCQIVMAVGKGSEFRINSNRTKAGEILLAFFCDFLLLKNEDMHSRGFNHGGLTKCLWFSVFWVRIRINKDDIGKYYTIQYNRSMYIPQYCHVLIKCWFYLHVYRSDGIVINDGIRHHVCITWEVDVSGDYVFYKDGEKVRKGVYARTAIPGGGVWVVGQDQDRIGGGFDKEDSFKGEMVETNIWNKVLTPQEILMMSKSCQADLPEGIIKSWKEFLAGVKGNVKKVKLNC